MVDRLSAFFDARPPTQPYMVNQFTASTLRMRRKDPVVPIWKIYESEVKFPLIYYEIKSGQKKLEVETV